MPPLRDPYDLLDVDRTADLRQIRAAYRRLAKRYHPDASRDDGRLFVALRNAYETLTDPDRREEWDRRHPGSGRGARSGATVRSARARSARTATPRTPAQDRSGRSNGRPAQPRDRRGRFTRGDAAPPWWEEIRGGRTVGGELPGSRGDPHLGPSSSGAAWSSAARAYFRRLTRQESGGGRASTGGSDSPNLGRRTSSQPGRAR